LSVILILSVCLVDDTEVCKDVNLAFMEDVSPMQCVMAAQPEIAKWIEAHPKWVQKKWKCARPEDVAEKRNDI
jgi:hypothetical protein